MIEKITRHDWPDTITVADGYHNKEVPEPSRRNLEFLADKFNSLVDYIYQGLISSDEDDCPCGSNRKYKDCCWEV